MRSFGPSFIVFVMLSPAAVCVAEQGPAVDFRSDIQPLLQSACLSCHNAKQADGGLRLDSRQAALAGGDNGPAVVPGKADESTLFTRTILPAVHDEIMPPDGPLANMQTARLKAWIAQGAAWPEDAKLQIEPWIDFVKHVQPILEVNCLACHTSENPEGDYDLSTRQAAFTTGNRAPCVVPFRPDDSVFYTFTLLGKDDDELMPPAKQGGPLSEQTTEKLRLWIAQGAVWPEGVKLEPKLRIPAGPDTPDNLDLVRKIHALIVQKSQAESGKMENYSGKVPKTGAEYHMVAIPGGEFLMGSPPTEAHRSKAEGPQVKVQVDPFWIGKYEVTWDEYEPFMITSVDREKHGARKDFEPQVHGIVDAVSQPTQPYVEMSFGMGQKGYPAISMTQHAANKYCQWLSAQTGHFYRLPTEAEWEYACRAGTTTAYHFGDDPARLGEYAWYYENSFEKYQKVGQKKPNPWGLYDMHGNVMEWTADQYAADYFEQIKRSPANPYLEPKSLYPRTVRGGGWDDDAEQLRSAARRFSDPSWKQQDPQLPKSIWYHTDAQWLGFRIVRTRKVPSVEEMYFFWNSATGAR